MGLMALLPVLALYVEERFGLEDPGDVVFWANVIYGAGPFSAACIGPVWGAMGDRYGKKRMAVRANLAIAVTTALMPLADTPLALLWLRIAQGAFAGYVAPAMALVSGHLPRYLHGRVIARLQVAMALGMFVGPYVGAELTAWFGRSALFWFASGASLLAAVRIYVAAVEAPPVADPDRPRGTFLGDFRRGVATMLGNRVFATLLVLLIVLRLGQNMLEPMVSLVVRDLGPQAWLRAVSATDAIAVDRTIAVAFAVLAIGQWFCTPWWGRMADRTGPLRCLTGLAFGLAVVQALLSLATTIDQFLLLRSLLACLMAGSMTLAYASVSKRVADHHRTLAFSLVQSCIQLGLSFGPLLGWYVADAPGGPRYRAVFVTAAVLCCAAGTGMVLLRRSEARAAV